ncbi:MAG: class I SAM-dependent rRNA methyltransferase, partial [Mesorhizobium sp.]
MKSFRDKRRDNRPPAKGGAEHARPRQEHTASRPQIRSGERHEAKTQERSEPKSAPRILSRRDGLLPAERLPLILEVAPNADYALLDSGSGQKLEQYGP